MIGGKMNNEHDKSSPAASLRRIDPIEYVGQGDPHIAFLVETGSPIQRPALRRRALIGRQAVDLRQSCRSVLETLEPVARARSVTLEDAQFATHVWANETLLRRVTLTLVDYQIRRAAPGSTVTLMTTPLRAATELRVIDWGDANERIPSDAHTLHGGRTSDLMPSNGRLSGCEFLIELQGGSIRFEKGCSSSAFYVCFPHGP